MDFRDFDKEIDELQQHQVQMNVEIDDLKSNRNRKTFRWTFV